MNILQYWEAIVGAVTIAGAYLGGRKLKEIEIRKGDEEIKSNELNNISSNFKVYQELINDLEGRFKARILELEEDLDRMKSINTQMRKVITDQENYIKKLKVKLSKYENLENG